MPHIPDDRNVVTRAGALRWMLTGTFGLGFLSSAAMQAFSRGKNEKQLLTEYQPKGPHMENVKGIGLACNELLDDVMRILQAQERSPSDLSAEDKNALLEKFQRIGIEMEQIAGRGPRISLPDRRFAS